MHSKLASPRRYPIYLTRLTPSLKKRKMHKIVQVTNWKHLVLSKKCKHWLLSLIILGYLHVSPPWLKQLFSPWRITWQICKKSWVQLRLMGLHSINTDLCVPLQASRTLLAAIRKYLDLLNTWWRLAKPGSPGWPRLWWRMMGAPSTLWCMVKKT